MRKHILIINTKAYKQGIGKPLIRLARISKRLARKSGVEIVLAVQPSEISGVSGIIPTFAQHIDAVKPGAFTGHILPEAVRESGATGTLINHSERRLGMADIRSRIKLARSTKLKTVCCAPYTIMVKKIASMKPDYLAMEPPELIGTGVSVSKARPFVIGRSVELTKKANPGTKVLCGAGISTGEDVAKALELGTAGVLVASSIVKSDKPEKMIKGILGGFG